MSEETTTQTGTTSDQTTSSTTTQTTTPTQAVRWLAQLTNGVNMVGGDGMPNDVNVSAVPANQVRVFTISGTTFSDTMYINEGTETWYDNGVVYTPAFPLAYTLADGSTLTITRNSSSAGDLTYTQQ